ncbi:hypothetical protein, partial [Arthrobacter sp. C152]
ALHGIRLSHEGAAVVVNRNNLLSDSAILLPDVDPKLPAACCALRSDGIQVETPYCCEQIWRPDRRNFVVAMR